MKILFKAQPKHPHHLECTILLYMYWLPYLPQKFLCKLFYRKSMAGGYPILPTYSLDIFFLGLSHWLKSFVFPNPSSNFLWHQSCCKYTKKRCVLYYLPYPNPFQKKTRFFLLYDISMVLYPQSFVLNKNSICILLWAP